MTMPITEALGRAGVTTYELWKTMTPAGTLTAYRVGIEGGVENTIFVLTTKTDKRHHFVLTPMEEIVAYYGQDASPPPANTYPPADDTDGEGFYRR